jgi:uncharacterized protein (UPF0335 family)
MAAARQNGYDPKKVKDYVTRHEALDADILKEHMAYMSRVGEIKEDQNEILETAKADGIPRKAIKAVLKVRKKERELENIRDDLEGDEQDDFDLLRHALGDLPDEIAKAAQARRQSGQEETSAALDTIGRGPTKQ